jgi:hypothetical protein
MSSKQPPFTLPAMSNLLDRAIRAINSFSAIPKRRSEGEKHDFPISTEEHFKDVAAPPVEEKPSALLAGGARTIGRAQRPLPYAPPAIPHVSRPT